MEEEKAAAYYNELTRKGEGAARFKQGLGFSANSDSAPSKSSALPSASSFLGGFVKASSPTQSSKFEKQAQLEAIQNKLKKNKPKDEQSSRVSERSSREREASHRHRSRSRERHYRRASRSRSRSRERHRDRDRERRRRSRSRERRSERKGRSRSRSSTPRERRRSEKSRRDDAGREGNGGFDYSRLILGYEKMTPAERVKARMKLQLNETAEKDAGKGMGSGWERFEFNKDAPLDDEEVEAAEDDTAVVKQIGQSFRFSSLEARREEQIKAAHDEAMFGASVLPTSVTPVIEPEMDHNIKESSKADVASNLLSDKVLAKQQGSWRDRARKM